MARVVVRGSTTRKTGRRQWSLSCFTLGYCMGKRYLLTVRVKYPNPSPKRAPDSLDHTEAAPIEDERTVETSHLEDLVTSSYHVVL